MRPSTWHLPAALRHSGRTTACLYPAMPKRNYRYAYAKAYRRQRGLFG